MRKSAAVKKRETSLNQYCVILTDIGDRPDAVVKILRDNWGWDRNLDEVIKIQIARTPVVIEHDYECDGVDQSLLRGLAKAGAEFKVVWGWAKHNGKVHRLAKEYGFGVVTSCIQCRFFRGTIARGLTARSRTTGRAANRPTHWTR
jgi:hypothetical protein